MIFGNPDQLSRSRTKKGPGRMPYSRHKVGKGTADCRGPGSMDCENEIRRLIHDGKRAEALELYEANERVFFRAGDNPGIPRLRYWYTLAKAGDERAA